MKEVVRVDRHRSLSHKYIIASDRILLVKMHIVDISTVILQNHWRLVPHSVEEGAIRVLFVGVPISVQSCRCLPLDKLGVITAFLAF